MTECLLPERNNVIRPVIIYDMELLCEKTKIKTTQRY